jgi:adenosine deaminase
MEVIEPKVELHCHLVGVIDPGMLRALERKRAAVLADPNVLASAYPVVGMDSFVRWLEVLKPYQGMAAEHLRPILAAHVENLAAQGVAYSEIMISPTIFPGEFRAMLRAFHRWREWSGGLERGRVQVEYVMVVPRSLHTELLERDTETFLALRREGLIAGVALVGPEDGAGIARFARSFSRWRDAGLGIEIHAGEHSGPESVWDALRNGNPSRLGHAISAFEDPALVEEIRRRNIHIEFCLTSNLRTGAVARIEEHPVVRARELGLNFSLNTDDPGAFECSMESEFDLAKGALGFEPHDFRTMFRNALASRFEPRSKR